MHGKVLGTIKKTQLRMFSFSFYFLHILSFQSLALKYRDNNNLFIYLGLYYKSKIVKIYIYIGIKGLEFKLLING